MNESIKFEFKPRARLLAQLGEQLIKNEHIAVVELIKNSYDADATICKIELDQFMDRSKGSISIVDNGNGMNIETVKNAWLEPGSDSKLDENKKPKLSPVHKRLPIGEKGIGRFGVHKLGNKIKLITKKENAKEVVIEIDWSNIDNIKYLEDFPISVYENDIPIFFNEDNLRKTFNLEDSESVNLHGTFILIENLKKEWTKKIILELGHAISSLQSPFQKSNQEFYIDFNLKQNPEWLDGLPKWDDIKQQALFRFNVKMRGSEITKFDYYFEPYDSIIHKINKKHLTLENNDYLNNNRNLYNYDEKIFINLSKDKVRVGEVTFSGYIFDLDTPTLKLSSIENINTFKKYLKNHTGVKVFRDGLRVYDYGEPENDWLNLDQRRFNSPTKGLSNSLLVAAVSLDRAKSIDLVEKTNREGFVENQAYLNLKKALNHVIGILENLRYTDKLNLKKILDTGVVQTSSQLIGEAVDYVEGKVTDEKVRNEIVRYFNKVDSDLEAVKGTLLGAAGIGLSLAVVVHEAEKRIRLVSKIAKAEKASPELLDNVKKLSKLIERYVKIIRSSPNKVQSILPTLEDLKLDIELRQEEHNINVILNYENDDKNLNVLHSGSTLPMVLSNLIDNSVYWLDHKYDVLGFEGDKKIFIDIKEDDDYGYIIVADNGLGFQDIHMDTITEPFVTYKPQNTGMGLGLHVAQQAMFKQKGDILFPNHSEFEVPEEFNGGALVVLRFMKGTDK